jgi:putative FmdB family regulatory protein
MPIYEYKCQSEDCAEVQEKLRKIAEADDPLPCERCGSQTKRMVSQASFQLKGGGWYKDGYSG